MCKKKIAFKQKLISVLFEMSKDKDDYLDAARHDNTKNKIAKS